MNEPLSQEIAEARRRFDEACEQLRPDLHRFCTRMTGNPCDGEGVLHDALVLAFYRLSEGGKISLVRDYARVDYLLRSCVVE